MAFRGRYKRGVVVVVKRKANKEYRYLQVMSSPLSLQLALGRGTGACECSAQRGRGERQGWCDACSAEPGMQKRMHAVPRQDRLMPSLCPSVLYLFPVAFASTWNRIDTSTSLNSTYIDGRILHGALQGPILSFHADALHVQFRTWDLHPSAPSNSNPTPIRNSQSVPGHSRFIATHSHRTFSSVSSSGYY